MTASTMTPSNGFEGGAKGLPTPRMGVRDGSSASKPSSSPWMGSARKSPSRTLWICLSLWSAVGIGLLSLSTFLRFTHSPHQVKHFELPRIIEAELTKELLTTTVPEYEDADESDLQVFLEFARSVVLSKISKETELVKALEGLKEDTLAVVVSGVPQDPYKPLTPTDGSRSLAKNTQITEIISAGLSGVAGLKLISYPWETEYSNTCFHQGFARSRGSAISGNKHVGPHLEASYLPEDLIPDVLVLAAFREGCDKKVETVLVDNRVVLSFVSEKHRKILREQRFVMDRPTWVDPTADHFFANVISLVSEEGDNSFPMIRLPAGGPKKVRPANPVDEEAKEAIKALYRALDEVKDKGLEIKVHLKAGDVLLFNNKHVLHSRYAYSGPLYDGHDRLLFRSYWVFSTKGVNWEKGCDTPRPRSRHW